MPPISPEQFNEMRKDYDRQLDDVKLMFEGLRKWSEGKIENLETKIQGKVSYKLFWIVVTTLCTVIGTLLGIIYSQEIRLNDKFDNFSALAIDKISKTQTDVSFINGLLQNAEVKK
jgi:hypothetical protein